MSELIDRQALLDECLNHYEVGNIEQNCTMDWICKTVRNFPAASPWHRVELEEPTKAGWYLVMDVDGDFNVDEWHNTFGWQFVTPSDADRITYWMPIEWMPIEPPKEDA